VAAAPNKRGFVTESRLPGASPRLVLEVLVSFDVVRDTHELEARVRASPTRRKPLAVNARYFVRLSMGRVVGHQIDTRRPHSVAGLKHFANLSAQGTILPCLKEPA